MSSSGGALLYRHLGFPTDTPVSIARDIEIIKKELPVDILEFFCLTPLPGSEDHKNLNARGVPMDSEMNSYDLEHACTAHPRMSKETWLQVYTDAWARYYTDEHVETIMRRAAASKLSRLQARQRRARHPSPPALHGAQKYHAYGSIHRRLASLRISGRIDTGPTGRSPEAGACSKISYSITSSAASRRTSSWPLGDSDGQRSPETPPSGPLWYSEFLWVDPNNPRSSRLHRMKNWHMGH